MGEDVMTPIRRLALTLLAAVFVLYPAYAQAAPPPTAQLLLDERMVKVLGLDRFACVVQETASGEVTGLTAMVTTARALRQAKRAVRAMGYEGFTTLKRVSQRQSMRSRFRVGARVQALLQPFTGSSGWARAPLRTADTCDRVGIMLSPQAPPGVVNAAWLAVRRYGPDRVAVQYVAADAPLPA
jgi:hypothetical protein